MNTHKASPTCSSIKLVTASGEPPPIISCVEVIVNVTDKFAASHQFLIVSSLIYPVIFGTDFLYKLHTYVIRLYDFPS